MCFGFCSYFCRRIACNLRDAGVSEEEISDAVDCELEVLVDVVLEIMEQYKRRAVAGADTEQDQASPENPDGDGQQTAHNGKAQE